MKRAPTHDYKLNQDVMYLDPTSKKWFPATIVSFVGCKKKLSDQGHLKGAEYKDIHSNI